MEGYLRRRSRKRVTDPCQCNDITRMHTGRHEHHCKISRSSRCGSSGNDVRYDCKVEGNGDVKISLPGAVGVPGVDECCYDGQSIGWNGKEEQDNVRVSQSGNNSRKKVCDGARGHEAEQDDHLYNHQYCRANDGLTQGRRGNLEL